MNGKCVVHGHLLWERGRKINRQCRECPNRNLISFHYPPHPTSWLRFPFWKIKCLMLENSVKYNTPLQFSFCKMYLLIYLLIGASLLPVNLTSVIKLGGRHHCLLSHFTSLAINLQRSRNHNSKELTTWTNISSQTESLSIFNSQYRWSQAESHEFLLFIFLITWLLLFDVSLYLHGLYSFALLQVHTSVVWRPYSYCIFNRPL